MAFGRKPTHHHTSGCIFGSSHRMNTGTKPWTLHWCTLDMTRLPRRHTNSGNPKMFFDKSLRATESVVVVRIRWRIVVAVGDPRVRCIIVPGTATQDAGTSA